MLPALPFDASLPQIQSAVTRSRAVVIVADPGAGKTTRVPPSLLAAGRTILLQPRRAAARAIARRIADEQGWQLGREVGWHVRNDRQWSSSTRLVVATEGILTAFLQQDPLLSDFATIIIDEFHERSIHADLAIAMSRQAMDARDDLRVVVMSATIDEARVAAFLGHCPVVRVAGRMHPLHITYLPTRTPAEAVESMLAETSGDVLCFQPGAVEIQRTINDLQQRLSPDIQVLPLHGSLDASEQDRALTPDSERRRVIVSTNIAETSVTVPRITGVVDSGVEKVARYDAERGVDSLTVERITAAAATQRAGRAGRIAPGTVYRLWRSDDRLRPFREPDIHRIDLAAVALDVCAWGASPETFGWFDAPAAGALRSALQLLTRLGAIDGSRLTELGRCMHRLALPPRLARIVLSGAGDRRVIRAAAMLAERYRPAAASANTPSDLLSALDRWAEAPPSVHAAARQIEARLEQTGNNAAPTSTDAGFLRAVLSGYPDRVAQRRAPGSNRLLLATGTGAVLGRESGVLDAPYLVALDVQAPTRPDEPESRIRVASRVEPDWLAPTRSTIEHTLDDGDTVRARAVDWYDAIRLTERPVQPDPDRAAELLSDAWRTRPKSDADEQVLRRLQFAGLATDIDATVRQAFNSVRSLQRFSLRDALPYEVARALDRAAPEHIDVPSGRRATLEYAADGSVSAAVKLQELFGLAETPRVGERREPVLLSLLAPNGRSVQLTRDLRSFWERTYPEVRKELRGRYPRHPWPEDPWNAVPTHRARPRH
ncbi:MAG: ATP-dependent helicase C-terminal domain-containing protein [Vicinamibacterales bacterium]